MYQKQKTHEQFLEELLIKNESYKRGEFKVLNKYTKTLAVCYTQNKYEILELFESDDGKYISTLEDKLLKENKEYKYLPKIKFGGYSECFSKYNISQLTK